LTSLHDTQGNGSPLAGTAFYVPDSPQRPLTVKVWWAFLSEQEVSDVKCKERLERYLREHKVPFEVMAHAPSYTMQEVAAALHVSGKQVAKVVIVKADEEMVMLVLPAPYRLNLGKVRTMLGTKKARLAQEGEFADFFPDCAPGAMPPFGNLYDVPVYVDRALAENESIVFRVGTHRETMRIAYADLARLARPTVDEFAYLT
jgi:Ala-tRNA(Pro) deacylase